jgi:cell volume regulation protein A
MTGETPIDIAHHVLSELAIILAICTAVGAIARKIKIPDIVLYLLIGMTVGPTGLGWINVPADGALNQAILIFGAAYLVFDGGASLSLKILQKVWITIVVIATVGILITGAISATAAYYAMGVPVLVAMLIGAVIASTDPATLVPIFKQVPIRDTVSQTVMSESAFNDAMGAIATFAIVAVALGSGEFSASKAVLDLGYKAGVGAIIGIFTGIFLVFMVSKKKIGLFSGYSSVFKIVSILCAFLFSEHIGASGFMAVFILGIVVGNKHLLGAQFEEEDQVEFEGFVGVFALMMRMFIFLLLGSQVNFELMNQYLVGGVIVSLVLMFIARPITVFACCLPDRRANWSMNEMLFMCWTRETGVIPAALAGILVGMKVPGAEQVAAVTFIAILMTIIIQASTTPWLAKKLGLLKFGKDDIPTLG